jgi:hypothetical protein
MFLFIIFIVIVKVVLGLVLFLLVNSLLPHLGHSYWFLWFFKVILFLKLRFVSNSDCLLNLIRDLVLVSIKVYHLFNLYRFCILLRKRFGSLWSNIGSLNSFIVVIIFIFILISHNFNIHKTFMRCLSLFKSLIYHPIIF